MNTESKQDPSRERIGYGVRIPNITFAEAIRIIKVTVRLSGLTGSIDALAKAADNSPSSSNFKYKLSALKNYGLLTISNEDTYALTDIGKKIVQPQSPDEEADAIVAAFSQHDILNRIWENYKGKILPQREYLANFIGKHLNIPAQLTTKWGVYFYEAASFAKLLDGRESGSFQVLSRPLIARSSQILESTLHDNNSTKVDDDTNVNISIGQRGKNQESYSKLMEQSLENGTWGTLTQRKLSGGRKAIFAIPDELTQQDIETLRVILKGIDTSLEGWKKNEETK